MVHLSRERTEAFYAVHKDRPFFPELVEFMTSGPCVVQVLEGEDAIAKNREVMGATNPAEAAPGTIRADYRGRGHRERGARFGRARNREERDRVLLRRRRHLPAHPLTASSARDGARPRSTNPSPPTLHGSVRETEMREFFSSLGEKPFRSDQVLKWIHHRHVESFEAMTDLSKALRTRLGTVAEIRAPEVVSDRVSADGTRKWLFRVDSGNCVETVYIPDGRRGTLCVSSQVGCALNCTFCATAQQGFNRNLRASRRSSVSSGPVAPHPYELPVTPVPEITNVVLMGMGEPLLNLDNVVPSLELMLDDLGFGLARKRVTLSTAGVVPGIRSLAQRCPVSLAVSLHAPDDTLRDRLVPINRKYPIDILLAACREFADALPRQKITFEYVMLDGVNDTPEHARRLARRLNGLPAKVNLIPFNSFRGTRYRCSPAATIDRFRDVLLAAGVMTITRKTRGDDIDAACGQLAGQVAPRTRRRTGSRGLQMATMPGA